MRPRDLDPAQVEAAVRRAGASRVDPRDTRSAPAATDLSLDAIRTRQKSGGGMTGWELVNTAAAVYREAQRLAKLATTRSGKRAERASSKADEALRTAAAQIRLAQACPLGRPYLHALDLAKIQTIKDEVGRAFMDDPAALAVDTHRRIQDQRNRQRAEGPPR